MGSVNLRINKMSNLVQRIIAGVIGAGVIISGIYFSEWSFFILFFIVCCFSLVEFYRITGSSEIQPNKIAGIIGGLIVYCSIFLIEKQLIESKFYYLLFPVLFIIFIIELYLKKAKPFHNLAFTYLGIFYVALPFGLLNSIAFATSEYHYEFILGMLFLIWANDIGGYFSGMLFGKHKLFLRISPKKTWEGAIGGAVFSIAIGYVLSTFYTSLPALLWIIMACLIVVIGSIGDLVESLLKRSLAIKDSGDLIPGHGGFLDRFDSLILTTPFISGLLQLAL